jgi:RNA polymerase sigma factor for flagellar operon FliA
MLLEHLGFIDRTVGAVARRHALSRWEADDFGGQVKLKLIADDYAVWRKFRGKSRLTTYLTTVIQNLFRDYRIQQWGKWRPSAAAKRIGDVGVQLEALLYRDGFSFSEVTELLRTRFDCEASEQDLIDMAAQIRPRSSRRFEGDAALSMLRSADRSDERIADLDRAATMRRLQGVLRRVLASLESEDRLILKLRFVDGFTIRSIASTLDFDPRRIYGRVRRLLRRVREGIVEEGIRCEEVLDLLDWPACAVEVGLADAQPIVWKKSA